MVELMEWSWMELWMLPAPLKSFTLHIAQWWVMEWRPAIHSNSTSIPINSFTSLFNKDNWIELVACCPWRCPPITNNPVIWIQRIQWRERAKWGRQPTNSSRHQTPHQLSQTNKVCLSLAACLICGGMIVDGREIKK